MCQTPCFTQITSLHPHTNPLRKTMLFPFYRNTESSASVLGTGAVDESDHLSGERNTALFRKSGTAGHRSGPQWREERVGQEERLGGEEPRAEPSRSRGWSGEARRALPSPSTWREADTGEAGPEEFPTDHTAAVERMGLTDKTAEGGWQAGGCWSGNGLVPCPHPAEKLSPRTKGLVTPGPFPHIRPNKRIHVWTKEHLSRKKWRPPARAVAIQMQRRWWGKAQFRRSNRQELVIHWMWELTGWMGEPPTETKKKIQKPEYKLQFPIHAYEFSLFSRSFYSWRRHGNCVGSVRCSPENKSPPHAPSPFWHSGPKLWQGFLKVCICEELLSLLLIFSKRDAILNTAHH